METYSNPAQYNGKDWDELLQAMNPREIRKTLKTAYRRTANLIRDVARRSLASSGLRNASRMKNAIRVRVYSRGGGFMITVKPHGKSGYYKRSQDGKEKPVLMWAAGGTNERYVYRGNRVYPIGNGRFRTMKGNYVGKMPDYQILNEAERQGESIIDNNIQPELEKAVDERLRKAGWI